MHTSARVFCVCVFGFGFGVEFEPYPQWRYPPQILISLWNNCVFRTAVFSEDDPEFALIVSFHNGLFHDDFDWSSQSSLKQRFRPPSRAVTVCCRELPGRNFIHKRTVTFRVDNIHVVSFSMQMLVNFPQFIQELVHAF